MALLFPLFLQGWRPAQRRRTPLLYESEQPAMRWPQLTRDEQRCVLLPLAWATSTHMWVSPIERYGQHRLLEYLDYSCTCRGRFIDDVKLGFLLFFGMICYSYSPLTTESLLPPTSFCYSGVVDRVQWWRWFCCWASSWTTAWSGWWMSLDVLLSCDISLINSGWDQRRRRPEAESGLLRGVK